MMPQCPGFIPISHALWLVVDFLDPPICELANEEFEFQQALKDEQAVSVRTTTLTTKILL